MLSRNAAAALRQSRAAALRGLTARAMSSSPAADFELRVPFKFHMLDEGSIPTTVSSTKDQLMKAFRQMYTIRRMEIACDTEYKSRRIRGFCHLYDGQEAIAAGMDISLTKADNVITSYRCHGIQYIRGESVRRIIGELFGFGMGSSKGKGGSMHFYSKANKFWGGTGIVGAQIPVGVGAAFAEMYKAKYQFPVPNIGIAMYGDGAANQGQVYEAANMAKLWNVPVILVCENNQYGMGTSTNRSSANNEYFRQGGVVIPGVQADGMDVLATREAFRFCKEFTASGKGPIYLELKTYRYHGHSMSDPGITYRDRDEVANMRSSRDCIEQTKQRIISAGWASEDELKGIEKEIRAHVTAEVEEAAKGSMPPMDILYEDIYYQEKPKFIRGATFDASLHF